MELSLPNGCGELPCSPVDASYFRLPQEIKKKMDHADLSRPSFGAQKGNEWLRLRAFACLLWLSKEGAPRL